MKKGHSILLAAFGAMLGMGNPRRRDTRNEWPLEPAAQAGFRRKNIKRARNRKRNKLRRKHLQHVRRKKA